MRRRCACMVGGSSKAIHIRNHPIKPDISVLQERLPFRQAWNPGTRRHGRRHVDAPAGAHPKELERSPFGGELSLPLHSHPEQDLGLTGLDAVTFINKWPQEFQATTRLRPPPRTEIASPFLGLFSKRYRRPKRRPLPLTILADATRRMKHGRNGIRDKLSRSFQRRPDHASNCSIVSRPLYSPALARRYPEMTATRRCSHPRPCPCWPVPIGKPLPGTENRTLSINTSNPQEES